MKNEAVLTVKLVQGRSPIYPVYVCSNFLLNSFPFMWGGTNNLKESVIVLVVCKPVFLGANI